MAFFSWKKNNKQGSQAVTSAPSLPRAGDGQPVIIAIASGKGGVGKSTVSAHLAVTLAQKGLRVGLLDADLYGPSQPTILGGANGTPAQPRQTPQGKLIPAESHGVRYISMGFLTREDSPVVWRAPIAMRMLGQFLTNVEWGPLDILLVDLPPGTGDVQLTLAQQASLTGALIVTTPQDVALGIAKKGLKMFEQVNVPILGIVENMSGFTCGHCGHNTAIFLEGGGARLAEESKVSLLGTIPLDREIVQAGDAGVPVVVRSPESHSSRAFVTLAESLLNLLISGNKQASEPNAYRLADSRTLEVDWPDGRRTRHTAYGLRAACGCANCIDENTGRRILDRASIPLDIEYKNIEKVGRYGLTAAFSDGHSTGIYPYPKLHELSESRKAETQAFEV